MTIFKASDRPPKPPTVEYLLWCDGGSPPSAEHLAQCTSSNRCWEGCMALLLAQHLEAAQARIAAALAKCDQVNDSGMLSAYSVRQALTEGK